eukprot:TRINITY_DN66903_c7_g1_i3.p1 TRINITY_DN66903_c7_g1~~TRINITY_DN66903_c7_g1_i3.p1  ORF type:complete len:263 (+),score=21.27 TRINITY_DN66903_c7_g1_i3:73-789(+)
MSRITERLYAGQLRGGVNTAQVDSIVEFFQQHPILPCQSTLYIIQQDEKSLFTNESTVYQLCQEMGLSEKTIAAWEAAVTLPLEKDAVALIEGGTHRLMASIQTNFGGNVKATLSAAANLEQSELLGQLDNLANNKGQSQRLLDLLLMGEKRAARVWKTEEQQETKKSENGKGVKKRGGVSGAFKCLGCLLGHTASDRSKVIPDGWAKLTATIFTLASPELCNINGAQYLGFMKQKNF